MNTEKNIVIIKPKDNLTARKASTYARRRGAFMSADTAVEQGARQTDADKKIVAGEQKRGTFEFFSFLLDKRKKAAKEWKEALQKELKDKQIDKKRLQEFIEQGVGPKDALKTLLPSELQTKPAPPTKETIEKAWEKTQKDFPEDVVEQMQQRRIPPEEVVVFEGEYVSSEDLEMMKIVWEGFSGKKFSDLSEQQKAKIATRIAQGEPPLSAVVDAIVSGDIEHAIPEELSEEEERGIAKLREMHEQAQAAYQDKEEAITDEDAKNAVEEFERIREEAKQAQKETEEEAHAAVLEAEQMLAENKGAADTTEEVSSEITPLTPQVDEEQAEELRAAWIEEMGEDEYWDDRNMRETVEMMVQLNVHPEQRRKGVDQPAAYEVVENARIAEDQERYADALRKKENPELQEEIHALEEEAKTMRFDKAEELVELPSVSDEMPEEERQEIEEKRERMKQGLWEAHVYGKGQAGKFGGKAGLYNLTVPQLREKMRILRDSGYTPEQADKLITHGLAATIDPTLYDPDTFTDPRAQELARYVQRQARTEEGVTQVNDSVLKQASEFGRDAIRNNIVTGGRTDDEMFALVEQVDRDVRGRVAATDPDQRDHEIRNNLRLYLLEPELDLLAKNNGEGAIEWLNSQFDTIYQGTTQGQELDSPVLRQLENKVAYAISYLNYKYENRREIADKFFTAFSIRQKLMVMRVVIGQRNTESLQGAAGQLRMHGVMSSFGFEDQNVRRIYTRMNEKLDEMRLNMRQDLGGYEKKVTSEMVRVMQKAVEEDELRLFDALVQNDREEDHPLWETARHIKADPRREETDKDAKIREIRNTITRTNRMAYDLFVATQREAVIVARGRNPADDSVGYRSVPSGVFSFFNPEAMMWGGWDMKNNEAMEFYDRIKIDIAEEALTRFRKVPKDALNRVEKIEYGERLMRELSTIPDFFSSGWRADIYKKQIEELMIFKVMAAPTIARWRERYPGITKAQINDLLHGRPINLDGRTDPVSAEKDETLRRELEELKARFQSKGEHGEDVDRGKALASQFGLYLQLKEASGGNQRELAEKEEKRQAAEVVWQKIAQQKPEEIIKFIKDRIAIRKIGDRGGHHGNGHGEEHGGGDGDHPRPEWKDQLHAPAFWHDELDPLQKDLARIMGYSSDLIPSETPLANGTSAFDQFRADYGHVITLLRERAMREDIPRTLDLTHLTAEEIRIVNNAGITVNGQPIADAAERLQEGYGAMQRYISSHTIADGITKQQVGVTRLLVQDYRFGDIYHRVLEVDDLFQDELEDPPAITGLLSVSSIVSAEPGGDGYRRTMNDAVDGMKAMNGLYTFLTQEKPEEKMKGAQEYAAGLGSANGQEDIARAIRFTYGSYLDMSKPYYWLDLVGLKGLPGRISVSEIQKVYGPEAHVFEREELRQIIDRDLRFMLAASAGKKELQDKILYEKGIITAEEVEHRRHEYHHQNSLFLNSLKERIGVTKKDEIQTKVIQAMLFLILALVGSAALAATAVATEESMGSTGGGGGGGGHH